MRHKKINKKYPYFPSYSTHHLCQCDEASLISKLKKNIQILTQPIRVIWLTAHYCCPLISPNSSIATIHSINILTAQFQPKFAFVLKSHINLLLKVQTH